MDLSKHTYRKIEKEVSKLSVKSRLKIVERLSKDRLGAFGPIIFPEDGEQFEFHTYEIGVVAMFSLIVDKYNISITNEETWLRKTIGIIKKQDYLTEIGDNNPRDLVTALAYMQAYLKQYIMLIYRSKFLYNYQSDDLDLKRIFFDTYKTDYDEFLLLYSCIFAYSKMDSKNKLLQVLEKYTPQALSNLTISYDEFKSLYEPTYKLTDLTFINFNFLLRYPFIYYENELFIPFWPSVTYAITESLMFDITKKDEGLKAKIGKFAFEDYIYHITKTTMANSNLVILKEIVYNKEHKRTSDVMVVDNNNVLLVEAKFMNYRLSLRSFDIKSINYTEERMVDALLQVFKNIKSIRQHEIQHNNLPSEIDNILGVIVILDDYYLDVESIYNKAIMKINEANFELNIDDLKQMICFTPLYEYERVQYYSDINVVDFYKDVLQNKKEYNFWQYSFDHKTSTGEINMKHVNNVYRHFFDDALKILKTEENIN
jgi:hypothetical protein